MFSSVKKYLTSFMPALFGVKTTDQENTAMSIVNRERNKLSDLYEKLVQDYPSLQPSIRQMIDGYDVFAQTGKTPHSAYQAFRHLYVATKGASNAAIADHASSLSSTIRTDTKIHSVFGTFSPGQISEIADQIRVEGYFRLPEALPGKMVNEIKSRLDQKANDDDSYVKNLPDIGRTSFDERLLLQIDPVKEIAIDPLLREVATDVFRTPPILGYVNSWISRAHKNDTAALNATAQMFHFDMSHPVFLKAFIYLTDVDESNGPHCMIPKSHRLRSDPLWKDGRISDAEMACYYDASSWKYFEGKAGSAFIVDSSAFHKGMPVKTGSRHILEFYLVNMLFGEYEKAPEIEFPKVRFKGSDRFWLRHNIA